MSLWASEYSQLEIENRKSKSISIKDSKLNSGDKTQPRLSLLLSLDDNELLWSKWWPCHFRFASSEKGLFRNMRVPLLYVAHAFAIRPS